MRSALGAVCAIVVLLSGAATAHGQAPGCTRSGSELVFSAGPQTTILVTPGRVNDCDSSGVTLVRVIGTSGPERLNVDFARAELPVRIELGDGSDAIRFQSQTFESPERPPAIEGTGDVTVDTGPGDDRVSGDVRRLVATLGDGADKAEVVARESLQLAGGGGPDELGFNGIRGPAGPWQVDGGDGGDRLVGAQRSAVGPAWTVAGAAGDDTIELNAGSASCGPGADRNSGAATFDRTCGPRLDLTATRSGLGRYTRDGGTLSLATLRVDRPATMTVTVRTLPPSGRAAVILVRRHRIRVAPGPVRLDDVPLTLKGRAALRSRTSVRAVLEIVSLRTASGDDSGGQVVSGRLRRGGGLNVLPPTDEFRGRAGSLRV